MTLTDTSRTMLEDALSEAIRQQTDLDAHRASLEGDLNDVLIRLTDVTRRVDHLKTDLGIAEPNPDEPIPFTVIDDPWAEPSA